MQITVEINNQSFGSFGTTASMYVGVPHTGGSWIRETEGISLGGSAGHPSYFVYAETNSLGVQLYVGTRTPPGRALRKAIAREKDSTKDSILPRLITRMVIRYCPVKHLTRIIEKQIARVRQDEYKRGEENVKYQLRELIGLHD